MLKVKINISDAENYIAKQLRSDTDQLVIVGIEANVRQLELFPCLLAAQNAYVTVTGSSNKIAAIKALREACQARGFDIGLCDAKSVVEAFIMT